MSIVKNINDFKNLRSKKIDRIKAIAKADTPENPASDDDVAEMAALKAEIAKLNQKIKDLEDADEMEAASAKDAEPIDDSEVNMGAKKMAAPVYIERTAKKNKGNSFVRFVIGAGLADKQKSLSYGVNYVRDQFQDATVAKALASLTQGGGGALVPQEFQEELIELLMSQTVVRASGVKSITTTGGNLTIPRLVSGATASWGQENSAISTSTQTFDNIQMTARKLTAMTPVSNDLIRRSPLSVESIVQRDLVNQMTRAEDTAFLFGASGGSNPTGLLNLGVPTFTSTASPTLAVTAQVLQNLELSLTANNVDIRNSVWVCHPAIVSYLKTVTDNNGYFVYKNELDAGMLFGHKVLPTALVPTHIGTAGSYQSYMIFYNPDDLIIADSTSVMVDSSDVATYVTGGTTYSAFQTDQTVFRVIRETDFNIRHLQSAAIATVQNWTPTGYTNVGGIAYPATTANTTPSYAPSANTSTTQGS